MEDETRKDKKGKKAKKAKKDKKKHSTDVAAERKTIQLSNGSTSYTLQGQPSSPKHNVVCIHGIDHGAFVYKYVRQFDTICMKSNQRSARFLSEYLSSRGYRVLAIDLFGRGESVLTNKKDRHTAALFVNQIKEVVTHPDVGFVTSTKKQKEEEETKEDEKDTEEEEDEKPEKKDAAAAGHKKSKKKTGGDKSDSEKDNNKREETHFEGSFTLIGHSMGGAVNRFRPCTP